MAVDISARARVLGIGVQYKDMRSGNAIFLPQLIAIIAQGATDSTYSSDKWTSSSAAATGARYGYGSPAHLIDDQLRPVTGDGAGTIPVIVIPLSDAVGATAAIGDITPSGTGTRAETYRARVGGVLSNPFSVASGAADVTKICADVGHAVASVQKMPVKVTYTYGTVTSAAGSGNGGNGTCTALAKHTDGSPLPGVYRLTCNTAVANGGVFTLTDPNGTVISTSLTMTPGASQATAFSDIGGIDFTLTDATNDFEVNDYFDITVPATKTNLTSKWKGVSANDILIEIIGDSNGVAFAITQPTGGTVNPDVASALAKIGNQWVSMIANGLNIEDTTALDAYKTWGEGRWGDLVHAPAVVFTGCTEEDSGLAAFFGSSRKTDRINCQLNAPGSPNLPCVVAARQLARIAKMANENPPTGYGALDVDGIVSGSDAEQWDYPTRDAAVKAGVSTVEVTDGAISIGDVVTYYRPDGEVPPAYSEVVDIVKLQQAIYNLRLLFAQDEWASAPLIPDAQATVNPRAKQPKLAKAAIAKILQSLGDWAIISDPSTAKKNIVAAIDSANPKRLNVTVPIQLSGNTNVKSVDLVFGFYFGG